MNTELDRALQSCIDTVNRLLQMTEEDRERIRAAMSSGLMDAYLQGAANAEEKLKRLNERLAGLQIRARYEV